MLRVNTADGPRYLLAMRGKAADAVMDGESGMGADGEMGSVDLYVLKPSANNHGLDIVVSGTGIESGNHGEPGEVHIQKYDLHLYGFAVDSGIVLQGYVQETRAIYLPWGNGIIEAAPRIDTSYSNAGTEECSNDKNACVNADFSITPDTSSNDLVYPLIIKEMSTRGDHTWIAKFDQAHRRYQIPRAALVEF